MGELLEKINGPDDLKELSAAELKLLAEEVRAFIVGSVSKTGGHLASNLGVVELTLALHYAFDFKSDKLVWDVGHQCYAHKIITGRKDRFKQLRQESGLSGFPSPEESEYDQFAVGHAGTSIPTAIGMALGEQIASESEQAEESTRPESRIVVVVGDASIVNGASFEALNNLGLVKRQLLIVLNDNSMAIDATQGAVAKYFSRVRLSHTYEDLRKTTSNILEHMPLIGKSVEEAIEKVKKTIRMVVSASQMFESLNIPYFGPVDGHDVGSLIKLFNALGDLDHPAILHVYTRKGEGFGPAEEDRPKFHSTGPFRMEGDTVEAEPVGGRSFTSILGEHLVKLAEKEEKIVAITSAMCQGTGLSEFKQRFEKRFYDVGIAESAAVDIAAGLAKSGMRPVVCIYSTFLQRSFDQIAQEVSLANLPVVFCVDRAGVVGVDGPTHHGLMDIGFLRMLPNMVLAAPADGAEMKSVLEFAIGFDGPVVIRYPKEAVAVWKDDECLRAVEQPFKLGESVVVREREDSEIAIVSYGSVLTLAVEAADKLADEGIAVDVINARFAAPIDKEIFSLLERGKGLITLEDHSLACGFGSALLEEASRLYPKGINRPIIVLGADRGFIKHSSRKSQLMESGISADEIVKKAKALKAALAVYSSRGN